MVHFSGFARKMNHIPPSRERSERENQQFRFYVWFQSYFYKFPYLFVIEDAKLGKIWNTK
ncbi:MAG: hypothetical protein U5L45_10190 [Saprospiraceae bacterium]|nr:hypothetical protein [Saprospiraceae bacterium]